MNMLFSSSDTILYDFTWQYARKLACAKSPSRHNLFQTGVFCAGHGFLKVDLILRLFVSPGECEKCLLHMVEYGIIASEINCREKLL